MGCTCTMPYRQRRFRWSLGFPMWSSCVGCNVCGGPMQLGRASMPYVPLSVMHLRCFGYVVGTVDLMTYLEVPSSSSSVSRAMSRSLTFLAVVAVTCLLSRGQFRTVSASQRLSVYRNVICVNADDTWARSAPEIGTINSTPDSGVGFSCRLHLPRKTGPIHGVEINRVWIYCISRTQKSHGLQNIFFTEM